jgi:hypothetical protein
LKKQNYILIFFLFISLCNAQTWPWAKSGDGTGLDEGLNVTTDSNGDAIITGIFQSPTITFGTYTLTNSGSYDIYIVKYNINGNVLWAKSIPGAWGYSLSTDESNNIFVCGSFSKPSIIVGSYTLTNSGGPDVLLVKYDSNGNVIWAKSAGTTTSEVAYSVCTDIYGNVFITGSFNATAIQFGTYTLNNSGPYNLFLTKYDSNGNVVWSKSANSSSGSQGNSLSTDTLGNIYLTGYFIGASAILGTYTLSPSGTLLIKYDASGNVIWAKSSIDGTGNSVSVNEKSEVFVTGNYTGSTITFGTNTLINKGNQNVFLVKYDSNGNVVWAKGSGGPGGPYGDYGWSVSSYGSDVLITGGIGGASFTIGTYTLTPPPSLDNMYLAQYDSQGNLIYATALASGGDDQNAVRVDKSCNAYITGDFGGNPFVIGTNSLTSTGGENIFLAKFNFQCQSIGIKESLINTSLVIYPNPTSSSFTVKIEYEINNGKILLINSLGQKIHEQKIIQGENNVITNGLASGLYNCILLEKEQVMSNCKLAIE